MGQPAARVGDPVAHLPPVLTGGPGSFNVFIGGMPAWRGIPAASAAVLQSAKQISDSIIQIAVSATVASDPISKPGFVAAEQATKASMSVAMGSLISSMAAGADIHNCATPLPPPPHGPGVVVDGSTSVLINGLPACFMGNTIVEAVGPPNKILMGCPTVLIGSGPTVSVSVDTSQMQAQMEAQAKAAADKAKEEQKKQEEAAKKK